MRVEIHTDGACKGNPGRGGWAAILTWGDKTREISGGESRTTNNRMELTAVINALEALKRPVDVVVYSDSSYVIKGMTEWIDKWKRRNWKRTTGKLENVELWKRLDSLAGKHRITWKWVRGHAGDRLNERADRLAKEAIPS